MANGTHTKNEQNKRHLKEKETQRDRENEIEIQSKCSAEKQHIVHKQRKY